MEVTKYSSFEALMLFFTASLAAAQANVINKMDEVRITTDKFITFGCENKDLTKDQLLDFTLKPLGHERDIANLKSVVAGWQEEIDTYTKIYNTSLNEERSCWLAYCGDEIIHAADIKQFPTFIDAYNEMIEKHERFAENWEILNYGEAVQYSAAHLNDSPTIIRESQD